MSASASDLAHEWTKERILRGELGGGDMISEGFVSERVGVSRTPVREAFLRLEVEGYLKLYPKRGAMVTMVSEADLGEMLEARLLVEPWAVAKVAASGSHRQVAASLRPSIGSLVQAQEVGDVAGYQQADRTFHEAIVDGAGNQLMSAFYRSLRDRQLRAGAQAIQAVAGREAEIPVEHTRIAEAIALGDATGAEAAVRAHIVATWTALRLPARPG